MRHTVLPFPMAPGKTEADAVIIANRFKAEPEAYRASRKSIGCHLERAYLQLTPMGSFVVAYTETDGSASETLARMTEDQSQIGRWFVEQVKEIHGIDISQASSGPEPETVLDWSDPEVSTRRHGMAFCAPLTPGMEDKGRAFASEAEQSPDMTRTMRMRKLNREVVTLLHTPNGPIVAVYIEGEDPFAGNRDFAASDDPFDVWFKNECKTIYPAYIDFNRPVEGVSEIFDSTR